MINPYQKYSSDDLISRPQIRMRNSVTNKIKNSVVKSLQLRDLGQLRDRFEGQSYLDQQISKLHSFNAALNYLGLPLPEINEQYVKNFKPIIKNKGEILVVVHFNFDSLPRMKIMDYKKPRIFVLCNSELIYYIIGIASVKVLNDKLNYTNIDSKRKEGDFIGFDKTMLL